MGARTTDSVSPAAAGIAKGRARGLAADDLDGVIRMALRRLREQAGAERVACWLRLGEGPPGVVAEPLPSEPGAPPGAGAVEAFAALEDARDLGEESPRDAGYAAARADGFSAAAPVRSGAGQTVAVLLLGGPDDPPGVVRPRTLAALQAAARRLAPTLAGALAALRLAHLDAAVRRLDRLAGLGELVAEIVHEVRNPLVSVKTFLQLLPERIHDAEFAENFFAVVTEELQRIERLLDLVLEQAAPTTPARPAAEPEACPSEAVESVARLLSHRASASGVALATEARPGLPAVAVGADALRQVLLNLAMNALDVTPAGGRVELSARSLGRAVEIRVADSGPGVAPALRGRLFEPFFSTKGDRPGGLGLAISRRIVEEVGGTIAVLDRPGGGAIFRLRLPEA